MTHQYKFKDAFDTPTSVEAFLVKDGITISFVSEYLDDDDWATLTISPQDARMIANLLSSAAAERERPNIGFLPAFVVRPGTCVVCLTGECSDHQKGAE